MRTDISELRMSALRKTLIAVLAVASLTISGCGSEEKDDPDTNDQGPIAGTVTGIITYAGSQQAAIGIAALSSNPAVAPPVASYRSEGMVTFPHSFTMTNVPEGTWYIYAHFDVDGNHPMLPGPEDLKQYHAEVIEVTAGATTFERNFEFTDP